VVLMVPEVPEVPVAGPWLVLVLVLVLVLA
jgi:hypothetical protein